MWTDEAITELSANPNPLHINNVQMGAIDLFLTSSNCIVLFSFEHIFKKGIEFLYRQNRNIIADKYCHILNSMYLTDSIVIFVI